MNPVIFYKALSDETRLKCVLMVSLKHELCVCELMSALDDSQPKVSRHLAYLRNKKLLLDQRRGQWVYYRLNPLLPDWVLSSIQATAANSKEFLAHNLQRMTRVSRGE